MRSSTAGLRRRSKPQIRHWELVPVTIGGRRGWGLFQKVSGKEHNPRKERVEVANIAGWRENLVLPAMVDCVRRSGHNPSEISSRNSSFSLTEGDGYRLALAFRLAKRTDSAHQVERLVRAVRQLEEEEAYLWYSYLLKAERKARESRLMISLANLGEVIG